ncbi:MULTISPECIES: replication-associated recombination protein A [Duncaniella]|jgi:putative ATPase|uniref:replication-associated recombination protein A n=1 Tax=Duncaniella TaxID=2518495 RepID=UPI000AA2C707|nr:MULTISPECIES: replication-associated recombination protein A [Duncaniella]ROS88450.1 replication-associated recombination protein A [Muribaculaceae bacterium Isolate-039 (Harlan)]ROS98782.1 replication-associated recombination protein A [Muribaculaceae bacterium Isolate-083 (Janvier)]ROS99646.1 replication-associated recombination protein A [Muribaculaceae bacterium Isolate-077 (Janvier)]ROT02348.1 replication-associated recombination protein A [Muribaculaceae bacterium Isolate-084 (Janvier)
MNQPLAERLRPRSLDDYIGQLHLVGEGGVVRRMIESGKVSSFILWGPPGVGKTTLARIIANSVNVPFYTLSAVSAGVKEVREVIERCKGDAMNMFSGGRPILFIDEIHRFSKAQQDSLLGAVESGVVTLIGATTENPSFEVIRPLLSRAQVYTLRPLEEADLRHLLDRAVAGDSALQLHGVSIEETTALFRFAGGDARKLLNIIDLLEQSTPQGEPVVINDKVVTERLQENPSAYDKNGEMHYDIISAFIKSIRGSDPDAALYWLARMIRGGEDPEFIARRLLILAAEDISLANPNALLLANATFEAVHKLGFPEGQIPLAECTVYLALSAKSNSTYTGLHNAMKLVEETGDLPVPLHLRNAPTSLMKDMGYGRDYKYAHNYPGNFVVQQFMPDELGHRPLWQPCDNPAEMRSAALQNQRWQQGAGADQEVKQ